MGLHRLKASWLPYSTAAWIVSLTILLWSSPSWARPISPSTTDVNSLLAALLHGSPAQQNRAAQRLFHLQHPQANKALLQLCGASATHKRHRCAWALPIVRPKGAARRLVRLLADVKAMVRREALRGLGLLRHVKARRLVVRRLTDRDPSVRREAVRTLSRFADHGLLALQRVALRRRDEMALLAVGGIGQNPGRWATRALHRIGLRARRARTRLLAAVELQKRMDWRGAQLLSTLLRSGGSVGLRLQVTRQLGEELSDRGVRLARRALLLASKRAGEPSLRKAAAIALASLKRQEAK